MSETWRCVGHLDADAYEYTFTARCGLCSWAKAIWRQQIAADLLCQHIQTQHPQTWQQVVCAKDPPQAEWRQVTTPSWSERSHSELWFDLPTRGDGPIVEAEQGSLDGEQKPSVNSGGWSVHD
jgi:hypothetical protein